MRRLVAIPFYGDDPIRADNRRLVIRHLFAGGFDEQLAIATGPAGSTMAAARNAGLQHARDGGYDVVVFNDADSLVDGDRIAQACELALEQPGVVFAYDLYVRLSKDGRNLYASGEHDCVRLPIEGEPLYCPPSIGCVAVAVSGCPEFDEGFVGWGYEDCEWIERTISELGPSRRVPGPLYHLWHGERRANDEPEDSDPRLVKLNHERWLAARGG